MTTLEPPAPMADMNCFTFGSAPHDVGRLQLVVASCDSKEMSCAASVNAKIWPVSSLGEEALGHHVEEEAGREHGGEEDHERDCAVAQDELRVRRRDRSMPSKKRSEAT